MDRIARFKRSYDVLQRFFAEWFTHIQRRCTGHDQRQAAFCVWSRYSMSMCTLNALQDPRLLPDLAVICRACLEFDVALEAVIKDEQMARDYLNFDKDAKNRYIKILRKQGDLERMLMRREQFEQMFGEGPEGFDRSSWCAKKGGIAGLMRWLGRQPELRVYNIFSHFAHGTVWAWQMLDGGIKDPERDFAMLVDTTYTGYLASSRAFLRFAWEPLITPEGDRCKNDFDRVVSAHIEGTT